MKKFSRYLKIIFLLHIIVLCPLFSSADTCSVKEVMVSQYPFDDPGPMAAIHDGQLLLVTDQTAGTVKIIDTSVNIVSGELLLDFEPSDLIVSDDGTRLYVSGMFENRISVVDISYADFNSWRVVDTWTLESDSRASGLGNMALEGSRLYVADPVSNAIRIVNTYDGSEDNQLLSDRCTMPSHLLVNNGYLFVTCETGNLVSIFNLADQTFIKNIPVGKSPLEMAADQDGPRIYVANSGDGSITIINSQTLEKVKTVENSNILTSPSALWLTDNKLYVMDRGNARIAVFNTDVEDFELGTCSFMGSRPCDLIYIPHGEFFYVSHQNGVDYISFQGNIKAYVKQKSDFDFRRVTDLLVGSQEEFQLEIRGGTGPFEVSGTGGLYAVPFQQDERKFSVTGPEIDGFGALYIEDRTTGDIFTLTLRVGLKLSISPTGPVPMELGGQSKVFFATGGFPPYAWKTGKGTLSSNNSRYVVYTPPPLAGEDSIEVCDSSGECVAAAIELSPSGRTITPATGIMLPGEEKRFSVLGATGSCRWDAPLGGEIIETGENYVIYKASGIKGEYSLVVTDTLDGKSANTTIRVIDNDLEVTPGNAALDRNSNQYFSAVGGIPPYIWTVEQGNLDSTQGENIFYTAPGITGRYKITVRDAGGRKASSMIDVGGDLRISPVAPVINMGDDINFSLSGGEGDVTWRTTDGDLSGKSTTGAIWRSPIKSGTYYVIASDGRGNSVQAVVRVVSKNITVSPGMAEVSQGETIVLTAAGGSAPYTWSAETGSLSSSEGKTLFWRAPFYATKGEVHINVEDSAGEFAQVKVKVTPSSALEADPESLSLSRGGTGLVTVIGGTGIYNVTSDNPEIASASIQNNTITITGKQQGSTTIIIRDTAFNTKIVSLMVGGSDDLTACPANLTIPGGNTSFFTISGGYEPYHAVSNDNSIVTAQLAGNKVIVTGLNQGTASITITDTAGAAVKVNAEVTKKKKAIIVAGGGPFQGNVLWDTTNFLANYAYQTLLLQGYTKETVHYLSHDDHIDLDGNGSFDDIDGKSSNMGFKSAVTEWAGDAEELLIYIVDHGGKGTFRMSETESLEAGEIKKWLDQIQSVIPGKVIFIYDACMSGSFLPALASSSSKRVLITSSSNNQPAYFTSNGILSFSYLFWSQIINGADLEYAFLLSKNALEYTYDTHQTPLLDDNGNGMGNDDDDGRLARTTILGNGIQTGGVLPAMERVSPPITLNMETSAAIHAVNVTGSGGINRVWAVITPPDYDPGDPSKPVMTIPELEMKLTDNNRYEGIYTGFNRTGIYKVAVYAKDNSGSISMPFTTSVEQKAGTNYPALYPSTMEIAIPCLKFMGSCYGLKLNHHPIPSDPDNIFFSLDLHSVSISDSCQDGGPEADSRLNLTIPKIEIAGTFYGVTLEYSTDLSNSSQVIWRVDPASLFICKD